MTSTLGAASLARLKKVVGEYESRELGPLVVRRKDSQYRADFESWNSTLGVEEQPNGGFLVV
jgi:hypothetical protein